MLWLFRHNTKNSNAQKERLATSSKRFHLQQRCNPCNGDSELGWLLDRSASQSVGLSIQVELMDVARSAPQGAYDHADVTGLLLNWK